MKRNFLLFIFFFLLFNFFSPSSFSQSDGGKIFKQNCSRCHTTSDQKLTGPGLKGVGDRVPKPAEEWMHKWIKNNKAVLKSGDAYATKVYNENGKQAMDVFDGVLSDADIDAVIAYVKNPPAEVVAKKEGPSEKEKPEEEGNTTLILFVISVILLALAGILGGVKRSLHAAVNEKKGLSPPQPITVLEWISGNKRTVALIGIILTAWIAKAVYVGLMDVGVYEGYKPEQPIKFSHRIHAGNLKINCVYCHSGAEKGKTAGVPSANVCMNCHKAVSSGTETGTTEIAKIYDAVGWDSKKGTYDETKQHPIKWTRVHQLPDFAYFNHSQHVVVGKQDCKNCHGEVEKMDEAQQFSQLTMNWCLDCHRKTEVPGMASNPYYAELHEKLAKKYKGQPITVEKMGGLDCIKCHY